jgi:hypothetical protein
VLLLGHRLLEQYLTHVGEIEAIMKNKSLDSCNKNFKLLKSVFSLYSKVAGPLVAIFIFQSIFAIVLYIYRTTLGKYQAYYYVSSVVAPVEYVVTVFMIAYLGQLFIDNVRKLIPLYSRLSKP